MPKTIKLTDKIPRVDIEHYLAASGEQSRIVVLSEKDVTVIRSYLYPGVEWYTRFVRPLGGDNYETGTTAEFSEYLEMLSELDYRLSGGFSMSLETALESIADAITALAGAGSSTELTSVVRAIATSNVCCEQQIITQGGGVIGSTEQPIGGNDVPIFGTEDPLSLEPETFPEGYTDLTEYRLDKCQVSNLVVDGVIGTLRNLGAFGVFNGVALAGLIVAAIVGIIVFPPAFIPVAAAAIGFLSVEVTLLTLAANEMEENRDEWVCTIYNADGTDAAIAVLADLIDALIATIGATGGAAFWVKQILLLLFNADTLNKAMYKAAHITYPDADCSGCGGDCPELRIFSDVDGPRGVLTGSFPDFHVEGQQIGDPPYPDYYAELRVRQDEAYEPCDGPRALRLTNVTGFTPGGGTHNVYIYTRDGMEGGSLYFEGDTIPDCVTNVDSWYIRSATAFSFDVNVSDDPCV